MSPWFLILIQFTMIAYALVCGVFLAFSDFIMRSLGKTPDKGGVEAMQNINREVFRWVFMGLFLGLAPVSLFLCLYGFINLSGTAGALIVSAGVTYLIGCFGVTLRFNVPMNETLAAMAPGEAATQAYWEQIYLPNWTYWNTLRTAACAVASALLLIALPMSFEAPKPEFTAARGDISDDIVTIAARELFGGDNAQAYGGVIATPM